MTTTQTTGTDDSHPPSFESVWALMQENAKQHARQMEEFRKSQRESQKEFRKSQRESQKEFRESQKEFRESQRESQRESRERRKEIEQMIKENNRSIKILNEQMGGLHNKFGEMAEHLVAPGIVERFNILGYHFDGIADRGYKILDEKRNLIAEIDILLENGDYILAVEVKADVKKNDLKHHVKRLEILRQHRNKKHNDPRKIRGAIAGAIFFPNIKEMALENGFYVLEQSGDTMKMDIPEGFEPKEW